ncbi:uncharacterized protein LOC62_05G006817 [Vanrija pseudolonga]|uniref:Uncharacterized protein n=1 Tax=Vanrija pseudolonga TaxID=143232 RepID=A0AAF1BJC9_9TREE|nr:hypothetical protein LOC62_05G006817 [Vanrija pseudolonga]
MAGVSTPNGNHPVRDSVSNTSGLVPTQNNNAPSAEASSPNAQVVSPTADAATGAVSVQTANPAHPLYIAPAPLDGFIPMHINSRYFPQVAQYAGRNPLVVPPVHSSSFWCFMQAIQGMSDADKKKAFGHVTLDCKGLDEVFIEFRFALALFPLPPPPPTVSPHTRSTTYLTALITFLVLIAANADVVSLAGGVTQKHYDLILGAGFRAPTVRLTKTFEMIDLDEDEADQEEDGEDEDGEDEDDQHEDGEEEEDQLEDGAILVNVSEIGLHRCIVLSPAYVEPNEECFIASHPQPTADNYTIVLDLSSPFFVHNHSQMGAAYPLGDGVQNVAIILKGDIVTPTVPTLGNLAQLIEALLQVSDNIATYTVVNNHVGSYTFVGVERLCTVFANVACELLNLVNQNEILNFLQQERIPGTAPQEANGTWMYAFHEFGGPAGWFESRLYARVNNVVSAYQTVEFNDFVAAITPNMRTLLDLQQGFD